MRDDDEGRQPETSPEFLKDTFLCARVQAGGGLVQNQHPRFLQKRSREGEALTLPTRKLAAVRSDPLAKTVWQRTHQAGQSHHSNCVFDLALGGCRSDELQIGRDRAIEQDWVARQITNAPAQALEMNIPDVFSAEPYFARNRVIEPGDEPDKGTLASAVLSRDCYLFPR